jgi:protein O-GlcNAc transferase
VSDLLTHAEVCHGKGDLPAAEALCRRALSGSLADAGAAHLLAVIFSETDRFHEAGALAEDALRLSPDSAALWNDLGAARWQTTGVDDALPCFERAAALEPGEPLLLLNYGRCLLAAGRHEDGLAILASLPPDLIDADAELAIAASNVEIWRVEAAIDGFHRVLRVDPVRVEAHRGLAAAYWNLGDAEHAIRHARRALELDATPEIQAQYLRMIHMSKVADIAGEHREAAERWFPDRQAAPRARRRRGRLRVAYVSGLFTPHRATFAGFLAARHTIDVVCLSDAPMPAEFGGVEQIDTSRLSNEAVTALARKLGVDILVECDGYFRGGVRLAVFAGRAAPVQAALSCFYPASTGLGQIGFRITDAALDPPGEHPAGGERLLRLPHAFCFRPDPDGSAVSALPALAKGNVTFGSCSIPAKINAEVAGCWAAILRSVPASTLLIHHMLDRPGSRGVNSDVRRRIEGLFAEHGVPPERLRFVGSRPHDEHLRVYDSIDIALDPFPYNGGLTTLDALYMGVPVISLEGSTTAGRFGRSLLGAIGLDRLVAPSVDRYVAIATALAADLPALRDLRARLRSDLLASPLADTESFSASLEEAYHIAWKERNR